MRQFRIRDLLWLIALVAVALGWWTDHHEQELRIQRALQKAMISRMHEEEAVLELQRLKHPGSITD